MPANRPLEAQSSVSWGSLLAHFQIQAMRIFVFFLAALLGTAGILGTVEVARAAVLMAGTSITATKADSFVGGDGDGKADPGETIRYTTTITNTGAAAATGVTFNDVIDAHTTLVGGSVDVSPLAIDDTYDTVGNTLLDVSGVAPAGPTIHVAGSLFSNDVEFLGDTFDATHTHITAHVGPSHGTLTLDNNAGTFTYLPTAGYIGPDSFTYTLTDSAGLSDTATVTLNVFNPVWYVKNDAGAGGDGRSPSPFNTLAAAQAASSASETIYVYHGDGTVTNQNGGFVLKTGQRLLGAGVALNVPYTINGVANPTLLAAGTLPLISNTAGDGVSITTATAGADFSGVEIRGLSIAGTTKAINLQTTSTFNGSFEVGNNTIRAAGTNGIDAAGGGSGTLTVNLHDNTVTATGNGINIVRTAGSVAIIGFANNVVLGATGGTGINIAGPNVTFDSTPGGSFQTVSGGTTTIGTAGNGVGASGMLLTSVAGDLSFTDLDIVSSAGAGLQASGTTAYTSSAGFQVAVGAGVASIDATGGPAVDLNTVTANTLPFVTVVSTNSATTGVSLDTVIGTFSAGVGSSITNATGTDFNINATSAAVTYGGTITDNSGRVVSVTSTAGGTKSFTGAISGSGAGSTGISLTNNTGATISFSGGLTLSTGANPAFTATGGGTVSATQNNTSIVNTLTTTTGTALNVANTTIGASGLTFRSITAGTGASGPANAIILNTTGASGGLTVSGNGGAGTGGTIQKTSGNGISLTSVGGSASLTDMNISNTAGDGITAATVNNFSCTLCNITNPGSAANKQGLNLNELSGTASLTNVTVTGATQNGAFIQNTSATLTSLTISGGSYSSTNNAFASAGSGLEVIAKTTGVITAATVTGVTFNANFSSAIQSFAQDTATIGDITVSGSTFTNNGAAAADFDAGTGSPQMKFHFLNNLTITGNVGPVINVFSSATGTGGLIQGRIDGNNIGTNAVVDSGSTGGAGIRVFLQGVAGNITIVNNTIRSTACSRGIEVQTLGPVPANGGVRQSDIVITGNNVNNFSSDCAFPLNDIYLTSDNQAGGAGTTLRAEVHNNTIKTAGATPGNTDFPFDNLEWLYFDHTAGTAQLVDVNPGAPHANANAAIAGTQTSGTAKANAAVTLIPGPITTVSFVPGSSVVAAALQPGMQTSSAQIAQTSNTNINDLAVSADLNTAGSNFKQASWVVPQAAAVDDLVALHTHATSGGNNSVSSAVQPAPAQSGEAVGPITIGTLPAGKSVKVVYDVTVDDPLPQNATKILNQSTISGSNFTTALTTDSGPGPDCTGPGTETCTPIDLVDLAASKTNDTSGTVVLGNSFNWAITASNIATSRDAIFTTGQTVLADHLPGAATYGSVSATYDTGIVGTMSCSISSNVLTCTADAGGLTIPSGKFVKATWQVTPTSGGSLVNPTGGVCTVDPNAVFAEVSTANNSCSDTVTVTRPNTTVTSINRHTPLGANTNASSVTWRVTFANALSGLTSSNFTLTDVSSSITGDSISSVTPVTGSPDTQWDVTASTGSTGDGTLRPDLANDTGLSYAVTNAPYTSGQTYTIDKTGPLVSSIVRQSPASNPTNSDTLVFRVTFNEAVTNVGANSFVDTGTTTPISSSVTAITPNLVFDFTIDGTADGGDLSTLNGTVGLNIAASPTITDLAGNTLQVVEPTPSATNDQTYTVDNTAPTVTVNQAVGQSDPTNGSTINFTVVFSEPVTGFATGDVDLSAGTAAGSLTGTVSGGPTTYNVAVTGMTGDGTVIASILANKAQDLAGNNNAASTSTDHTVTYDTTAPTVTINQAVGQSDPTNGSPINFTAVFSESVGSSFATGDVTLSGGAGATTAIVSEIAPNDGTTYNIAVSGMTGDGTVIASILANKAQDLAGNNNAASTSTDHTVTYDTTAPTVTINQAGTQSDPAGSLPINFTVTFSEAVTGFATGDVDLSASTAPGTLTGTVTGGPTIYNVAVSGLTGDGNVIATIPASVAQDLAGNNNAASTSTDNNVLYDTVPPSLTINQAVAQTDPTSASPINFTVTFSEAVTGFATGDVDLSAGTAPGSLTGTVTGGPKIYNVAVSGMTGSGTVIASVPAGVAFDLASHPNTASTSTDHTVTFVPPTDLSITKTDGVTTAVPGGSVTYTITASNSGPNADPAATVADTFPASLTGVNWTCVGAGGGTCTASGSGTINDTVNLPAGASVTYTASATISASATGTLSNTATVATSANVGDTNPANNSATDSDSLSPQADLSITKTDGVITAVPGNSVTYTITASNSGPSNAPGATVADTFPVSLTASWICVGAGGGTCTASGSGTINDTVNLPSGGSVTYTVSASINAAATGSLSNTATVAAPAGVTDPTPGNNAATDTDTLSPQADLAITKTDGVTTAAPGGSVTYTITASNSGPSNTPGATVADTFPASLTSTWTCVGAGGGTCTASGSGIINDTANLPSGGSVTYTVSATISAVATGTLSNTATVSTPGGVTDPTPGNNSATDTDTLAPQADLAITKTDGATFALAGNSVTYTITASNAGPSNASGVTVADTFPASLTGINWTCVGAGGGTCTASGSGSINDAVNLPAGGSVTYTAAGTLNISATGTLSNTATVTSAVSDPTPGNNSATDSDSIVPPVAVTINEAAGQSDPTNSSPINFTVVFASSVSGFGDLASDVSLSGPAGATTANVTQIAPMDGTTYNVAVSGMTSDGKVIASIPAAVATGSQGQSNLASTSTDHTVTYDTTAPTVTINQAVGQSDTTSTSPVHFTATFNEAVMGFDGTDVTLIGTANPTTATVTEIAPLNGTKYDVAVSGMNGSGTITVSIPGGRATDLAGNFNHPSTTTTPGDTDTITNYIYAVPPVITEGASITVTMDENGIPTPFALTLHATDANSDPLTWSIPSMPSHGSASVAVGPSNAAAVSYTPTTNYFGSDAFVVKVSDGALTDSITVNVTIVKKPDPTVTINQAASQADPTNDSPINFTAVFSERVTGFIDTDVILGGTAGATTVDVTEIAPMDGTTYNVAVSGMTGNGTVIASIPAGVAQDYATNGNAASTSTDNTVTYHNDPPAITGGDSVSVTMSENGTPTPFALTLGASDPNSDPLTWSIIDPATFGTAGVDASTGVVSYVPFNNYFGMDTFVVQVSDGHGGTDSINVNVTIQQGNNPGPLIWNQSYDIQYDTWLGVMDNQAFGEGYRKATSGQFKFVAPVASTKVTWLTYRGPDQGKAQVWVDGVLKKTVNLYNATAQWRYQVVVAGLPNTKHTVVIKALNANVAPSTGNWVVVDGFKIGTNFYDDQFIGYPGMFRYGSWLGLKSTHARFGGYRISNTAHASMQFSFDGIGFNWVTVRGPSYGKAAIYVDGVLKQTVDLYKAGAEKWQYKVTIGGLAYGHHTVTIVVLGTKNSHSTGTSIICDGFEIF